MKRLAAEKGGSSHNRHKTAAEEEAESPQNQNGHIVCDSCWTTQTQKNKCALCLLPIENIVASVRVNCQYKLYGCSEKLSFSNKAAHEKTCNYVPCSCPLIGCGFVGTFKHLYDHFSVKHKGWYHQFNFNSKISISSVVSAHEYFILREGRTGVLFVLYRYTRSLGSFYNVVCVAPSASEPIFLYELTVTLGDEIIKVETSIEMMSKWTSQLPTKMSPVLHDTLFSTSQKLKLDLIIRKKPALVS